MLCMSVRTPDVALASHSLREISWVRFAERKGKVAIGPHESRPCARICGAVIALKTARWMRRVQEEQDLFSETFGDDSGVEQPIEGDEPGNPWWSGRVRDQLQWQMTQAETEEDLEEEIELALQENVLNDRAVASAVQVCGQRGWFDQLLRTLEVAKANSVQVLPKQQCVVFSSLVSCLRRHGANSDSTEAERRKVSLQLAQDLWMPSLKTEEEGNWMLSSALRLCLSLDTEEAFIWAESLWEWSTRAIPTKNIVTYSVWLSLLERQERFEEVNSLLSYLEQSQESLKPNEVLLGGLLTVDGAPDRGHWSRADELWQLLVQNGVVKPNGVAYAAYARVHLVSGRPGAGVQILEDMVANKVGKDDYRDHLYAVDYLQMLLVVCHSFPSKANLARLSAFLHRGNALVTHTTGPMALARAVWERLKTVAQRLLKQDSVELQEVLITWTAQQSVMKDWVNKRPGSGYLWDFA